MLRHGRLRNGGVTHQVRNAHSAFRDDPLEDRKARGLGYVRSTFITGA
ncbi:MAG: hypothetical protein ACXWNJ_16410 [Vulcanimicrobiaceae bacterium]